MSGGILKPMDLKEGRSLSCDVCVIGSGAGGAVLAAGLAERGYDVVVLEEGLQYGRADFDGDEGKAYSNMYRERGLFATADLTMTILQGRSLGGSTTVNWTTCFRTPPEILAHWRTAHGAEFTEGDLAPHWAAVEKRLSIREWPEASANANNQILFKGCRELGWDVNPMRRNVNGCVNSGYCGLGCPVDGKQGMAITYIRDAVAAGARVFTGVKAHKLHMEAGRVRRIEARVLDPVREMPTGEAIEVEAKITVSSGGAVGSPALLLRSGLNHNGRVGRRVWMHPVVGGPAVYPHRIDGYYGAPQSASSHQFMERGDGKMGWFLETPPLQPMLIASSTRMMGNELATFAGKLPYMGAQIALVRDGLLPEEEGATVSLRSDGRVRVDYHWTEAHREAFREASRAMAKISFAAGATEFHTVHTEPIVLRSEADLPLLDGASWGPPHHGIFTAHQMGGCPLGDDPKRSVVRPDLRHHEVPNLFVVDGSVMPTSLGVNPSLTVYGLAHWARDRVASAMEAGV